MTAILLVTIVVGCRRDLENQPSTIHVLVASSAAAAVQEVAGQYSDQLPDGVAQPRIVVVSGPSSGLAQQILSGAPADIFISASPKWRDAVAERSLKSELLLKNGLVLATHELNENGIETMADLSHPSVGSIAIAGKSVPVGHYANQVVEQLPAEELRKVNSKLVFGKDAAALVAWLERNEVDAGFVYTSDASRSEKLRSVQKFDSSLHDPIFYSITRIADEVTEKYVPRMVECDKFFAWLQSEEAKVIFRESGFSTP
jgi:molybdate transport system substrate-binding protein